MGLGPHFLLTNIFKWWHFCLQHSKISSKCFGKVILLSKVIPLCETLCEGSTKEGRCIKIKASSALIAVGDLENIMTLVFSGFSFILHLAHHLASLSRSLCRYSAAKSIFLLTTHWPKSSANCDLLVWW